MKPMLYRRPTAGEKVRHVIADEVDISNEDRYLAAPAATHCVLF